MNVDNILGFKPKLNDSDIVYRRKEKNEFESIAFNSSVRYTPMIFDEIDVKIIGMFNGERTIFEIISALTNQRDFNEIFKQCIEICGLFKELGVGNFKNLIY